MNTLTFLRSRTTCALTTSLLIFFIGLSGSVLVDLAQAGETESKWWDFTISCGGTTNLEESVAVQGQASVSSGTNSSGSQSGNQSTPPPPSGGSSTPPPPKGGTKRTRIPKNSTKRTRRTRT